MQRIRGSKRGINGVFWYMVTQRCHVTSIIDASLQLVKILKFDWANRRDQLRPRMEETSSRQFPRSFLPRNSSITAFSLEYDAYIQTSQNGYESGPEALNFTREGGDRQTGRGGGMSRLQSKGRCSPSCARARKSKEISGRRRG